MNEQEAKTRAIKETDYCYVLACAWEGKEHDSVCLERIFIKGRFEGIRLAWWKDGNQTTRPADIDAMNWVALFAKAVQTGVFTDSERLGIATEVAFPQHKKRLGPTMMPRAAVHFHRASLRSFSPPVTRQNAPSHRFITPGVGFEVSLSTFIGKLDINMSSKSR